MRLMIYVSCADDKSITLLELEPATGTLREQARVAIPGTDVPSASSLPMAISPDRRFLYAGLRTPPYPISSFAVDPSSGALTHRAMASLPDSMCYLSTDMTGSLLFSASYSGNKLAVSPIEHGLVQNSTQVVATPPHAHSVRADPANRFVYAASLGGDVLLCQRIDSVAGRIEPVARVAAATARGAGPRHLQFARGGTLLYVINERDGSLNTYACDVVTGALTELQSISLLQHPATGSAAAADLHLTRDERFLFGSLRASNRLVSCAIDPLDGTLRVVGDVASEPMPRGFAVEPAGRFLLCAGMRSGTVGVYAIDAVSGALERIGGVPVGAGPNWIEIVALAA